MTGAAGVANIPMHMRFPVSFQLVDEFPLTMAVCQLSRLSQGTVSERWGQKVCERERVRPSRGRVSSGYEERKT